MTILSTLAPERVEISDYFRPYTSDADIRHALVHRHRYTSQRAVGIIDAYHRLFRDIDPCWDGPICLDVSPGFTLKQHAPKAGPCFQEFCYLQDWAMVNDKPTMSCHVFMVPRLVDKSTSKNVEEQKKLLIDIRKKYFLPEHHLSNFGSAAMLAGLILEHLKRTGEKTPQKEFWARTDTLREVDDRLCVGYFGVGGLDCLWRWNGSRVSTIGCFPLGVDLE